MIQPCAIGGPSRQLFGLYDAPLANFATEVAVLLCNPFGHEAISSHRLYRVLGERLVRGGCSVLRFDYYGTGDSMGGDGDGTLAGWADDALTAHGELRRRSGARRVIWFGMRLGAQVALQAARRGAIDLQRLVLWDPVLDGPAYLQFLRERHVTTLERSFSLPLNPRPHDVARDPGAYQREAMGFELSDTLRAELAALRARQAFSGLHADTVVVCEPGTAECRAAEAEIAQASDSRARIVPCSHGTDWTRDVAENSALVPAQALLLLLEQIGARS